MTRTPAVEPGSLDQAMLGIGLLAGGANVIMQLARPGVGHGVVESRVGSGQIFRHPVKRTRTTITYLAVAGLGTEEEKRQYRRAVNTAHAQVHSSASSPVQYDAFDPELQLWVAACLYRGFEDCHCAFIGSLDPQAGESLYRSAAALGTTLQVTDRQWPADRAAFQDYWDGALAQVAIDDTVRRYLYDIACVRFLPRWLSLPLGPFNRFVTTGFLPTRFRDEMHLSWSPRQQRRFDRLIGALSVAVRAQPKVLRQFPFNLALWDLRRRIRSGRPLV
jgi:uncharacterized protein (DUF2236 family)